MMNRVLKVFFLLIALAIHGSAADHYAKAGPVELTKDGRRWAQKTLKKMSLEEKVGQMIGIRYYTDFENFDSDAYKQFRDEMQKYHIGTVLLTVHVSGGVLYKNPPLEIAAMANQLQRDSKLPLLVSADFERGLAMRATSVPIFPDAMAFGAAGDPALVQRFGAIVAQESRAVGIQWDFYPIADVNSNPDNPIINIRSYGEDPTEVGNMAAAFIHGARANGMLTSAKHFPGHGDTSTDSHLGVARVDGDLARLQTIELPPFKKAIDAGTDSVMIAHVTVPALEPDPRKVASTSANVIEGVLRKQLGFKGVVVTDAFEMRGLTSLYPADQNNSAGRAAVDAVKAGEDIILLPSDLDGVFNGIVAAVKGGEIPQARIDGSVERILEMKASVGLNKARLVDLEQVPHLVSRQEDLAFAQQVSDAAVTVVRDNGHVIPIPKLPTPVSTEGEIFQAQIKPGVQVVAIVMADSIHTRWERSFEAALKARRGDATVFYVDNSLALPLSSEILQAVKDAGRVVVAAYLTPVAAKQVRVNGKLVNTVGLPQNTGGLLSQILDVAAAKTAVVALGNPYMAQSFPNVQTYICTFSAASSSELSAVKTLFGELKPGGKLPVTLPGIAARGFSMTEPRSVGKP